MTLIITKQSRIKKNMSEELKKEVLEINEDETKFMRHGKKSVKGKTKIGKYTFEEVEKFKYLGIVISNDGEKKTGVKEKIISQTELFMPIEKC